MRRVANISRNSGGVTFYCIFCTGGGFGLLLRSWQHDTAWLAKRQAPGMVRLHGRMAIIGVTEAKKCAN
jgi:hypothetical protein